MCKENIHTFPPCLGLLVVNILSYIWMSVSHKTIHLWHPSLFEANNLKTGLNISDRNDAPLRILLYVATSWTTMNTFNSFYSNNYYNLPHHHPQSTAHPNKQYHNYYTNFQGLNGQAITSPSTESCPASVNNTPTDVTDQPQFYSSSPKVTPPPTSDSPSNSSKVIYSSHKGHNHHHHSIQELIRHFGKKVHHWRSEGGYRRASCSEDSPRKEQEEDEFRERSKSLDGAVKRRQISDCEATYRIYNTILKEGTCWDFSFSST